MAAILMALPLGQCGNTNQPTENSERDATPENQWMIVPANDSGLPAVWRINTKSGLLDFCWRSFGNGISKLVCENPVEPQLTDAQLTKVLTGK